MFRGSILLLLCGAAIAHEGTHADLKRVSATLTKDAGDLPTRLKRAQLYRLHGEHARALEDLDEATRRGADPARVALQRGLTLAAMGRHEAAIEHLSARLAVGAAWTARVARARSHRALGRRAKAVADYDVALAARPQVEVFLERGALQSALGRPAEAATGYRAAIDALGPATLLVEALVEAELVQGRAEAALTLIEARLKRRAEPRWLLRKAQAQALRGDEAGRRATLDAALGLADAAVRRRPTAINLVLRARVHLARAARADARADLKRALAAAPDYAPARRLLQSDRL